jgi:hypothetical protein
MKKYRGHTVEYWKQNAEEDYIKTPISVLKYITVLEEQAEQLNIDAVDGLYITLKRKDLIELKKDIPVHDVTIDDFKSTSVTKNQILRAYYVCFSDGNVHKVLKDRFA